MKIPWGLVLAGFVALVAGCNVSGVSSISPTPPLRTGQTTTTETFTGTLVQAGSDIHTFPIKQVGDMAATLTSLTPVTPVGFVLGSYDGNACQARFENDNSGPGQVLSGTPVSTGIFCVRVFDTGGITAGSTVAYSVRVVHP